jgi:hypothetical protein
MAYTCHGFAHGVGHSSCLMGSLMPWGTPGSSLSHITLYFFPSETLRVIF